MRIALTVDPYIPVPPLTYGGIERVVDLLVRGLVRRGHDVRLFAHAGSTTPATLYPYGVPPHESWAQRFRELAALGAGLVTARPAADVVHSFGRLAALLPILPLRHVPKIQSYQRAIPWTGVRRAAWLAGRSLLFTGCSSSLYTGVSARQGGPSEWRTVFNGVDTSRYTFRQSVAPDAPLVFLGRIERIKGPHHAIAIARTAGRPLIIAGNVLDRQPHRTFFDTEVAPAVDGSVVQYVGAVDDDQKNVLLGRAAALLMPIEWEEPFGIVMAEAMACGTPVIGFRRGSVPEVVRDGVTGFVCDGVDEAVAAVARLATIDRAAVRAACESHFGADVIVTHYESLYTEMAAR